jgi:hypothetical protein
MWNMNKRLAKKPLSGNILSVIRLGRPGTFLVLKAGFVNHCSLMLRESVSPKVSTKAAAPARRP